MRRTSFIPYWLVIALLAAFTLSGCERPVPREDPVAPVDVTPATPIIIPTTPVEEPGPEPEPGVEQPSPTEPEPAPEQPPTDTPVEPTPDPGAPASTGPTVHTVQPGETLGRIAQRYNVSINDIAVANNIVDINRLQVGQQLTIPAPGTVAEPPPPTGAEQVHIVQSGENLYRIGLRYGFTVAELAAYNNIANPHSISVGQAIRIPAR